MGQAYAATPTAAEASHEEALHMLEAAEADCDFIAREMSGDLPRHFSLELVHAQISRDGCEPEFAPHRLAISSDGVRLTALGTSATVVLPLGSIIAMPPVLHSDVRGRALGGVSLPPTSALLQILSSEAPHLDSTPRRVVVALPTLADSVRALRALTCLKEEALLKGRACDEAAKSLCHTGASHTLLADPATREAPSLRGIVVGKNSVDIPPQPRSCSRPLSSSPSPAGSSGAECLGSSPPPPCRNDFVLKRSGVEVPLTASMASKLDGYRPEDGQAPAPLHLDEAWLFLEPACSRFQRCSICVDKLGLSLKPFGGDEGKHRISTELLSFPHTSIIDVCEDLHFAPPVQGHAIKVEQGGASMAWWLSLPFARRIFFGSEATHAPTPPHPHLVRIRIRAVLAGRTMQLQTSAGQPPPWGRGPAPMEPPRPPVSLWVCCTSKDQMSKITSRLTAFQRYGIALTLSSHVNTLTVCARRHEGDRRSRRSDEHPIAPRIASGDASPRLLEPPPWPRRPSNLPPPSRLPQMVSNDDGEVFWCIPRSRRPPPPEQHNRPTIPEALIVASQPRKPKAACRMPEQPPEPPEPDSPVPMPLHPSAFDRGKCPFMGKWSPSQPHRLAADPGAQAQAAAKDEATEALPPMVAVAAERSLGEVGRATAARNGATHRGWHHV